MGPPGAQPLARRGAIAIRIGKVRIGGTEARVEDHVVGIVIGKAAVLDRPRGPVGQDQPVQAVIAVGPGARNVQGGRAEVRGDAGDLAIAVVESSL